MKTPKLMIVAGVVGILASWLFAVLSIDSRIEFWYVLYSAFFGLGGLGLIVGGVTLIIE